MKWTFRYHFIEIEVVSRRHVCSRPFLAHLQHNLWYYSFEMTCSGNWGFWWRGQCIDSMCGCVTTLNNHFINNASCDIWAVQRKMGVGRITSWQSARSGRWKSLRLPVNLRWRRSWTRNVSTVVIVAKPRVFSIRSFAIASASEDRGSSVKHHVRKRVACISSRWLSPMDAIGMHPAQGMWNQNRLKCKGWRK